MKKLVLVMLLMAGAGISARAQIHVGVQGSFQLATQRVTGTDLSGATIETLPGFRAGLMVNAPLLNGLSVRPQLMYSVKGFKTTIFNVADFRAQLNYLELPVLLTYGIDAGPGWLTLGAGPYVGYALNGKITTSIVGQSESEPIEFGSGEEQLKRFDAGLMASLGYDLPMGASLNLYVAPGLLNLSNTSEAKTRNFTFGVSLGYWFGANR